MTLRVRRLFVAVPLAELLAVLGIVVPGGIAFAFTDATVTARIIEMQQLALWTAPAAGFASCLLGGWWVARGAIAGHERNGLVLGLGVAVIDLVLLVASGAPLGALLASSALSRIAGGYCGGKIAGTPRRLRNALTPPRA